MFYIYFVYVDFHVLIILYIYAYSTCHNNTRRVKLRNLPRRVDLSFLRVCPGGLNSHGPKSDHFKELFALLDFCSENHIFVMTISTISMRQNCSISFSTDPEGTNFFLRICSPPDIIMTCRVRISRKPLWKSRNCA